MGFPTKNDHFGVFLGIRHGILSHSWFVNEAFPFEGLVKLERLFGTVSGDGLPHWLEVSYMWGLHLDFQTRAVASISPGRFCSHSQEEGLHEESLPLGSQWDFSSSQNLSRELPSPSWNPVLQCLRRTKGLQYIYCWWKKSCSSREGSLSYYLQGFVHPT